MHTAEQILSTGYGLSDCRLTLLRTTGGALKDLWRVETPHGICALKRYRPDYRSESDLNAHADLQQFMRTAGFPVPPIHPDRNGRVTHTAAGSNWVLYQGASGRHVQPETLNPRAAAAWGETLGRLQLHLQGWTTVWTSPEPLQVMTPEEGLPLLANLLRHAEQGTGPLDELCRRVLRHSIAGLERLGHQAPRVLAMERQWLHGDINEGNFFFSDDDRVSGIIDFDNVRQAPRGFDFIYGLHNLWSAPAPARDAYARAYLQTVGPAAAEMELWVPLWQLRQLCDIWPIDIRYLRPADYDPAWRIWPPAEPFDGRGDWVTEWLLKLR